MYEIFEKLCAENGVSAYRVAQETGVTTATLTSWKQGKYAPKTDKLQKLADYFNVDLDYLMGKSDIKKKIPVLEKVGIDFGNTYIKNFPEQNMIQISNEAKQFALAYDKAPEDVKQMIQTLLKYSKPAP